MFKFYEKISGLKSATFHIQNRCATYLIMKYRIIICFFIVSVFSQSQTKRIDSLVNFGKIIEAKTEFQKLSNEIKFSSQAALSYAEILSLNNEIDSSFFYLEKALVKDSAYRVLSNGKLYNLISDKRWHDITENQLRKYQLKRGKFADFDYAKKLIKLKQKDQQFYYEVYLSQRLNGENSPITKAIWKLKELINSNNLIELESLIQTHGYPKCSEKMPCAIPFLIIQHSNLETQLKYINQIKELCKSNDIPCNHYAMLTDRIRVHQNKPQLFGTQYTYNKDENGKSILYEVYEPEKLNERRRKIGLKPLKLK